MKVFIGETAIGDEITIILKADTDIIDNNIEYYAFESINRANISMLPKEDLYREATSGKDKMTIMSEINALSLSGEVVNLMFEIISAK